MQQPMTMSASEMAPLALRDGIVAWSAIDVPWSGSLSAGQLADALSALRRKAPATVLGSHLPPAIGRAEALFDNLIAARAAPPFAGPDQAALEQMLRLPQAA